MKGKRATNSMDVCKHCGERMGWPRPVGVVYADRTAAHHACDERYWKERLDAGRGRPTSTPTS